MTVHHVMENPKSLCDNSSKLFITMCHSCHSRMKNKETKIKYTEMFIEMLKETNWKCYISDKEYFKTYKGVDIDV